MPTESTPVVPVATVEKRTSRAAPADSKRSLGTLLSKTTPASAPSASPPPPKPHADTPSPARAPAVNRFEAGTRDDGSFSIAAPDLARLTDHQNLTEYWCGAMPDSLIQTIDVKGVSFPRYTNMPEVGEGVGPDGQPVFVGGRPDLGTFVHLTDAQVAAFIKAVQRRVLRRWDSRRGQILDIDHKGYRANPERDRPLGEVIYMVPVSKMTGKTRSTFPTPLISNQKE